MATSSADDSPASRVTRRRTGTAGCDGAWRRREPGRGRGRPASSRARPSPAAARTRCPSCRRRSPPPSLAALEVDDHGHTLEPEPGAELVLDVVGIVAGDKAAVVDNDTEPRRPRVVLGRVQQVQTPAAAARGFALGGDLLDRPVQRPGTGAGGESAEQL